MVSSQVWDYAISLLGEAAAQGGFSPVGKIAAVFRLTAGQPYLILISTHLGQSYLLRMLRIWPKKKTNLHLFLKRGHLINLRCITSNSSKYYQLISQRAVTHHFLLFQPVALINLSQSGLGRKTNLKRNPRCMVNGSTLLQVLFKYPGSSTSTIGQKLVQCNAITSCFQKICNN